MGPEQTKTGSYLDDRPGHPTGLTIIYRLDGCASATSTDHPTVQITRGVQLHLSDLLDTDIEQSLGSRHETVTLGV
ncbi:hypothetical protein AB0N93_16675 [Streptomyces sp. NPDC091267]|uniref:hypothetical protein n=1 Tax=Streptomyces sp. NPDC091267 TaxID=3155195 RepID=UPI00342251FF